MDQPESASEGVRPTPRLRFGLVRFCFASYRPASSSHFPGARVGRHASSRSSNASGSAAVSTSSRCSGRRKCSHTMWSSQLNSGSKNAAVFSKPMGLACNPELRPGEDLEQLVGRPEAAGQGDEGVGAVGHDGLALVHRLDHDQFGQPAVGQFLLHQEARDDADRRPPAASTASARAPIRPMWPPP